MVIWLIGLSGAGKTTIGERLAAILRERQRNLVFLDGDLLRDVWGGNLGHHIEGRRMNAERISKLCRLLDRQGIDVVAAVLSIFPEWQSWNRREFSRYFEVFIDAPLALVERRDVKGIYAKARRGETENVVGIDIEFPRPVAPDLVIGGRIWSVAQTRLRRSLPVGLRQPLERRSHESVSLCWPEPVRAAGILPLCAMQSG